MTGNTMAKTGVFENVEFEMIQGDGYYYYIIARYRGKDIKVRTSDSKVWDYIDDDSDEEKHHYARRYCYNKIVEAYRNLYE